MLTEIGKFMITSFSGEKNTMWLYFTVQFRKYKPANQKAEKGLPGKHCDTKSHVVCCVKKFPTTKSVDLISKRMRGQSGK